jgi:hypothetical protein
VSSASPPTGSQAVRGHDQDRSGVKPLAPKNNYAAASYAIARKCLIYAGTESRELDGAVLPTAPWSNQTSIPAVRRTSWICAAAFAAREAYERKTPLGALEGSGMCRSELQILDWMIDRLSTSQFWRRRVPYTCLPETECAASVAWTYWLRYGQALQAIELTKTIRDQIALRTRGSGVRRGARSAPKDVAAQRRRSRAQRGIRGRRPRTLSPGAPNFSVT